jgi:hypothetical protein
MMAFIYLASPYTAQQPDLNPTQKMVVMSRRFEKTMELTAVIFNAGRTVFSPIVHGHEMAITHDMPKEFEFWRDHDFAMISACNELWVHAMDGWEESPGVTAEIKFARAMNKPIYLVNLHDEEIKTVDGEIIRPRFETERL